MFPFTTPVVFSKFLFLHLPCGKPRFLKVRLSSAYGWKPPHHQVSGPTTSDFGGFPAGNWTKKHRDTSSQKKFEDWISIITSAIFRYWRRCLLEVYVKNLSLKNLSFSKPWLGNLKRVDICYKQKVTSRKLFVPSTIHLQKPTTIKGAEFQPARGFQRPANENRDLRTPGDVQGVETSNVHQNLIMASCWCHMEIWKEVEEWHHTDKVIVFVLGICWVICERYCKCLMCRKNAWNLSLIGIITGIAGLFLFLFTVV